MSKILIIGQAPPIKGQTVPYDTTLLYEILSWVDIKKDEAQLLFEFDAVSNEFPGINKQGGHKPPSKKSMDKYWIESLGKKVMDSDKIWILGSVAAKYLEKKGLPRVTVLKTLHPSRRNHYHIHKIKNELIDLLTEFLNQ